MKLIIIKTNFKDGLLAIERAGGENQNLPILKNVFIEAVQNKIIFTATNLEIAIRAFVSGKTIEDGKLTVPLSVLLNIIHNLQSDRLNLEAKENVLRITTDNYEATLHGIFPDEFPIIPKIQNTEKFIAIKGDILRDALGQVVLSAQFSDLRPELNSVLLAFSPEAIRLAATDSFRLSEKTITKTQFTSNHDEEFKILIPLKTIHELMRILADGDAVKINHDANQILFSTDRFEFISRLVDGNFPDYSAIIPKKFDTEAVVKREEFTNAVKVAAVLSSRVNEVRVKASESKKTIEVFSTTQSVGENTYLLPAKIQGKSLDATFNWRYVMDALKALKTEDVFLGLNDENKPALLRSPNDASYFYILMPILKT